MTRWPTFQELVEEEVKRLEPILRDRKIIPTPEEWREDRQADDAKPTP